MTQDVSHRRCRTNKLTACTIAVLAIAGIVASAVGPQKFKFRMDANDPSQPSSGDMNFPSPASLRVSRVLPGDTSVKCYPNCHVDYHGEIGDVYCHGEEYNTEECGWDGEDCVEFNEHYPDYHVDYPEYIGEGICMDGEYNTEECGWDGGDCVEFNELYPDCHGYDPWMIGNGVCYGEEYNTEECGWDGGDCIEFNELYPNCTVERPYYIGDGACDGVSYNTEECRYDGGDCCEESCKPVDTWDCDGPWDCADPKYT